MYVTNEANFKAEKTKGRILERNPRNSSMFLTLRELMSEGLIGSSEEERGKQEGRREEETGSQHCHGVLWAITEIPLTTL